MLSACSVTNLKSPSTCVTSNHVEIADTTGVKITIYFPDEAPTVAINDGVISIKMSNTSSVRKVHCRSFSPIGGKRARDTKDDVQQPIRRTESQENQKDKSSIVQLPFTPEKQKSKSDNIPTPSAPVRQQESQKPVPEVVQVKSPFSSEVVQVKSPFSQAIQQEPQCSVQLKFTPENQTLSPFQQMANSVQEEEAGDLVKKTLGPFEKHGKKKLIGTDGKHIIIGCTQKDFKKFGLRVVTPEEWESRAQTEQVPVSQKEQVPASRTEQVSVSQKGKVSVSQKEKVSVSQKEKVSVSQKEKAPVSHMNVLGC
jgi:hypothetical protein